MTFDTGYFIFLAIVVLLVVIAGAVMSFMPSQKHGHKFKNARVSLMSRVKKTGIGKLPENIAYQAKKKFKDMGKEKPEVKVKSTEPKKEATMQINRPLEKNENPWNTATFYYEQGDVTNKPCGKYRIGDKYKSENGKEYTVLFTIEPYVHKGQKYLGVSNPHLTGEAYKEIDDFLNNQNKHQISYESPTFQKAYSH